MGEAMMRFMARQKFRFDLGQSFMSLVNFCLLTLTVGDKLSEKLGIELGTFTLLMIPIVILLVWLFGYLLDRANFWHSYQAEQNERNTMLKEALTK
jgi:uncharacterized membrane protein